MLICCNDIVESTVKYNCSEEINISDDCRYLKVVEYFSSSFGKLKIQKQASAPMIWMFSKELLEKERARNFGLEDAIMFDSLASFSERTIEASLNKCLVFNHKDSSDLQDCANLILSMMEAPFQNYITASVVKQNNNCEKTELLTEERLFLFAFSNKCELDFVCSNVLYSEN